MRLLVTADLHYNHPTSRPLADELIDRMNTTGGDALLVVGDTAAADGDLLEQCLSRFRVEGPKLFVPGNHELWTARGDSYEIFRSTLPRRVRALGWHWLQGEPFRLAGTDVALAGSLGWYDYAFAQPELQIPRRFYERKISPGAAEALGGHADLFEHQDDVGPVARQVVARWNDAKFVRLNRSDDEFLEEVLSDLRTQLDSLRDVSRVIVGVHHLPFAELLPPAHSAQWDFAKAFLGSPQIGQLLQGYGNVLDVYCGHSHFAAEANVRHVRAVNVGSGYRAKTFKTLEIEG